MPKPKEKTLLYRIDSQTYTGFQEVPVDKEEAFLKNFHENIGGQARLVNQETGVLYELEEKKAKQEAVKQPKENLSLPVSIKTSGEKELPKAFDNSFKRENSPLFQKESDPFSETTTIGGRQPVRVFDGSPTNTKENIRAKYSAIKNPTIENPGGPKESAMMKATKEEARQKAVKEAQPSLEGKDLYQGAIPNIYETEANRTARINQENHTKLQSSRKTIDEKLDELQYLNFEVGQLNTKIGQGTATKQDEARRDVIRQQMRPLASKVAYLQNEGLQKLADMGKIPQYTANYLTKDINRTVAKFDKNNLTAGDVLTRPEVIEDVLSVGWAKPLRSILKSVSLNGIKDEEIRTDVMDAMNMLTASNANTVNSNMFHDIVEGAIGSSVYMGQFMITGGISNAIQGATKGVAKNLTKNLFKQGVKSKTAKTVSGYVAKNAPKMIAFATLSPFTYDYVLEQAKNRAEGEDFTIDDIKGTDFIKGYAKHSLEFAVEGLGGLIPAIPKGIKPFDYLSKITPQGIKAFRRATKLQGLPSEYFEEKIQEVIDITVWDEGTWREFVDPKSNLLTLSVCALIQAPTTAVQSGIVAQDLYKNHRNLGRVSAVDKNVAKKLKEAMKIPNAEQRYQAVRDAGVMTLPSLDSKKAGIEYFIRGEKIKWQQEENTHEIESNINRALTERSMVVSYINPTNGVANVSELVNAQGEVSYIVDPEAKGGMIAIRPVIEGQLQKPMLVPESTIYGEGAIRRDYTAEDYATVKLQEYRQRNIEKEKEKVEAIAQAKGVQAQETVEETLGQVIESESEAETTQVYETVQEQKATLDEYEAIENEVREGSVVSIKGDDTAIPQSYKVVRIEGENAIIVDADNPNSDEAELPISLLSVDFQTRNVNDATQEEEQKVEELKGNTVEQAEDVNQAPVEQESTAPVTEAVEELPTTKDGQVDIEKLNLEQSLGYLAQTLGIERTIVEAKEQKQAIERKIVALGKKKTNETNITKRSKVIQEIVALENDIVIIDNFLSQVEDVKEQPKQLDIQDAVKEDAVKEDVEVDKLTNSQRLDIIDEKFNGYVHSMQNQTASILYEIAKGQKFIWDGGKLGEGIKGLGQELGFLRNNLGLNPPSTIMSEFKYRLSMISDKGVTPVAFSERMAEEFGYDQQDAYNEIVGILLRITSPKKAIEELESMANSMVDPRSRYTAEDVREMEELDRQIESEKRSLIDEVFTAEVKQSEIDLFNDANSVGMTYEEFISYNDIDVLINEIETRRNKTDEQTTKRNDATSNESTIIAEKEIGSIEQGTDVGSIGTESKPNQNEDESGKVGDKTIAVRDTNQGSNLKEVTNDTEKGNSGVVVNRTPKETNEDVEVGEPLPAGRISGITDTKSETTQKPTDIQGREVSTRDKEGDKEKNAVSNEQGSNEQGGDKQISSKGDDAVGGAVEKKEKDNKIKELEAEADKALDDFLDAFNDFNDNTIGIADNQAEKQAKMLVAGTKMIGAYTKLGVYRFADIVDKLTQRGIKVTQELLDALKSAYGSFAYTNNEDIELDSNKEVRAFKISDIKETKNEETNERESTIDDKIRNAETIEDKEELITATSVSIANNSEDVGDNKTRANEVRGSAQENIERVETLLNEIDEKLSELKLSDEVYSVEGVLAEVPIKILAKKDIKKDVDKYVKAVVDITGLTLGVDKKGKKNTPNINIAPSGGDVYFTLYSDRNPYVRVNAYFQYSPTYDENGYLESYSVNKNAVMWRIEYGDNQYQSGSNNWISGEVTAKELSEILLTGLNQELAKRGLPQHVNEVKEVSVPNENTSLTENKPIKVRKPKANSLSLFDEIDSNKPIIPKENEHQESGNEEPNTGLGEQAPKEDGRLDGTRVDTSSIKPIRNDGDGSGGVSAISTIAKENKERKKELAPKNTRNNRGEKGVNYAPKSPKGRFDANTKAIKLMKGMIKEGRTIASETEIDVLRRYSGWGGLGTYFNNESKENTELKELLTTEEYTEAVNSLNSAYYTPTEIIDELWNIIGKLGFEGGNILESSAGIGNILATIPDNINRKSNIEGVEIDLISGNILKLLYPDAKINIQGFEDTDIKNGSVDLAITNVPFVTGLKVFDPIDKDLSKIFNNIHDYFIAKNIRKLKKGGIGVFITSSGTLDNSKELRSWIIKNGEADVIGAFRLNNETFGGTKATSDIIIVQKRVGVKINPNAIDISQTSIVRVVTYKTGDSEYIKGRFVEIEKKKEVEYNTYFVKHPEHMGGEMALAVEKGETYRQTSLGLYAEKGKDQNELLNSWAEKFTPVEQGELIEEDALESTDLKEGSLSINSKGEFVVVRFKELVPIGVNSQKVKGKEKSEVLDDYNTLKKAVNEVLDYQLKNENNQGIKPLLDNLNKAYDTFVDKYGYLNKNTSISFLKNDVEFPSVTALEKYSEKVSIEGKREAVHEKTAIFKERVIGFKAELQPKTIKDAVIASMYIYGNIDVAYISAKLGVTQEQVRKEVLDESLGYENPLSGNIEISYEYLSGNVREKRKTAMENNKDGVYDSNITALEKVIPMDIPAHNIEFSLGSSWLDPKFYTDFVKEKFGVQAKFINSKGAWVTFDVGNTRGESNKLGGVTSEKLGKSVLGHTLVEHAMNNKPVIFSVTTKDYFGNSTTIHDKEASLTASRRIEEIKEDFREWAKEQIQKDPVLSEEVERTYNEKFNNIALKVIDDIFLPERFEGASELIMLNRHQKVATIKGTTAPLLLAHEVGTGKTFTLVSTAMEMRRLGTAKKPMLVVQNATVGQIISETKKLYPNAKVLSLGEGERTKAGRRLFYAKIKYSDWDIIIVPQSVFEMIPDSQERIQSFIDEKIDEAMHSIEALREAGVEQNIINRAERELELMIKNMHESYAKGEPTTKQDAKAEAKKIQNAVAKVKKQIDRHTDDVQNFDDLGIDAILVDEAHAYKRLGFSTTMKRGVKGIDPIGSKRSASVYLKVKAVMEKSGGKNVVFATGTPISNTAAEIWTFMKYLIPEQVMRDNDIYYFDDFVRNFGKIQQSLEFTTSGKFKENTRFSAYMNVPELIRLWNSVADVVLTKEVESVNDKVPLMETGQAQDIFLPQTRSLIAIMRVVKRTLEEFENMSGKQKKENSHIPIVMYGIAKRAAIDTRLVDEYAIDEANTKTNKTVAETLRAVEETKSYLGTVAIFCDQQNRRENGVITFDLFEDIKGKLIEGGIPESQIMVMKSGLSIDKKEKVFADVNSGAIRVIIGNTSTLGTGVNIQERLHTLIHMDAPARPMDYTQRNGRILRQGNMHKHWGKPVRIIRFGVEDSLDVTAYQTLKTKASFINSIMDGDVAMNNNQENRVVEESEEGLFDNILAVLSGSQYALLLNKVERDLRTLVSKKKQHETDQIYITNKLRENNGKIKANEGAIQYNNELLEKVAKFFPEGKVKTFLINGEDASVETIRESILSGKINKEVNEKLEKAKNTSFYQYNTQTVLTKVTLNGVDFLFQTSISKSFPVHNNQTNESVSETSRTVKYTCPELGLKDMYVSGGFVKAGLNEVLKDIITGNDFKESIEGISRGTERLREDIAVMEQRQGKTFDKESEIKALQDRAKEYSELMKAEQKMKEDIYNAVEGIENVDIKLESQEEDDVEVETETKKEDDIRFREDTPSITPAKRFNSLMNNDVNSRNLDKAESEVNTNPTEAQKEAGNYKMGHVNLFGLDITIENPKGSVRKGVDESGRAWESPIKTTYGYIKKSKGIDGDQVDVFIGKDLDSQKVYVIDQVNNNSTFDEHKCVLGCNSETEARKSYLSNYEKGWTGLGTITEVSLDKFNDWVLNGRKKQKPFAEYKDTKKQAIQTRAEELSKELNSNVIFVSSDKMPKGHSKDKAYYNIREKQTYINIDAHQSVEDVEKSVLHEVVAHEGLREMFGSEFDTFLDDVYKSVTGDVRSNIDNKAQSDNLDKRVATEEYLAELAENGFEKSPTIWGKVKQFFQDMISRAKIKLNYRINDNDLSYILWCSYNAKKNTILDKANDVVSRKKWGVDEDVTENSTTYALAYRLRAETIEENKDVVEKVINHKSSDVKKKEKLLQVMIDFRDAGIPIKNLVERLTRNGNKVFTDVYTQHQTMSSRVMSVLEKFSATIGADYLNKANEFILKHKVTFGDIGNFHQALYMRERTAELLERGVKDSENDGLAGERGLAEYMEANREEKGFPEGTTPEDYIEWFTAKVNNTYLDKFNKRKRIDDKVVSTDKKGRSTEKVVRRLIRDESEVAELVARDISELKENARAIVRFSLDEGVKSGAISRQEYNSYIKSENYVPLRGWQSDESAGEDNIFQRINVVAKGRKSLANNPIPYMYAMASSAVQFGVKNQVKQNLVTVMSLNKKELYEDVGFEQIFTWDQNNENGEFVGVKVSDDINDFNNDEFAVKESLEVTSVLLADKSMAKIQAINKEYDDEFKQHLLGYYVNGKKRTIYVKDKALVLAFEKEKIDAVTNIFGVITSGMARMMTARNPDFILRNVVRDTGTVLFLNNYDDDVKFKQRILSNMVTLLPTVVKGVATNQWRSEDTKMATYNEWLLSGGTTGYVSSLRTLKDLEKQIERQIGSVGNRVAGNLADIVTLKWVEYGAEMFENVTRFSVYVTALEKGLTKAEALKLSKECSVNFDKKGKKVSTWSKYFAFLNPTLQGINKIYEFSTDKRTQKKAAVTFVMLGVAGFMSALLGDLGDDKVEERSLYKKRRSIMVGGVAIPMSFDLLPPFMIGHLVHELINKEISSTEFMYEVLMSFTTLIPDAGQNIIGSIISYDDKSGSIDVLNPDALTEALPTALIPIMQLVTNTNFMGGQIVPENKYKDVPQSALYKEANVNSIDKLIAKVINMSGTGFFGWKDYDENTYYVNGKKRFDVSPATVNHLLNSYATGMSRFWGGVSSVYDLVDRKASTDEVLSKTPIVGGFYAKPNPNLPIYKDLNKLEAKYGGLLDRLEDAKRNSKMKERSLEEKAIFEQKIADIKKDPLYKGAMTYTRLQSRIRKLNANIRFADKIGDKAGSEKAKKELEGIREEIKNNNKE